LLRTILTKQKTGRFTSHLTSYITRQTYLPAVQTIAAAVIVLSVGSLWSHDSYANTPINSHHIDYQQALSDLVEFNPGSVSPIKNTGKPTITRIKSTATTIINVANKAPTNNAQVAIIIDDIGYNYAQGLKAIQLPGAITYAIIPHSPKATFFAQQAQQYNKEIMLHAPMSTVHNTPLGQDGLTESMGEQVFKQALADSLSSLPNVKGVNNHMGSLLTQKDKPMSWVMQSLKQRKLYFIDSRTSAGSVAWDIAQKYGIPSLKRDIFLDHEVTEQFIDSQFKQLIATAQKQGYAVAIAHPYPETIRYLEQNLSTLATQNITLVPASELAARFSSHLMSPNIAKTVTRLTKTTAQ
jgi:polysaccharide deacetylase 2 family uncharacterized protein YibQ